MNALGFATTTEDAHSLTNDPCVNLRHYTSAEAYYTASTVPGTYNLASQYIDAGREAYLVDLDAVDLGMHPFIPVHDIMIAKQGEKIGLDTAKKTFYVEPNTLLAWIA